MTRVCLGGPEAGQFGADQKLCNAVSLRPTSRGLGPCVRSLLVSVTLRRLRAPPSRRDPALPVGRPALAGFRERAEQSGGLPKFVTDEFETYLRCGILEHGFAHFACRRSGQSQ